MDKDVINILKEIADKYRINPFIKRDILNELLLSQIDGKYKKEVKLLCRISSAGFIVSLAKAKISNHEKERIIDCLYDDVSIDKNIATEIINLLSNVINYAWEKETAYNEEISRLSAIKNIQERTVELKKMNDALENSFSKIIKSYGIEVLNNYDFCRAILKDMAHGHYIDEITLVSVLLKKKIQNVIIKPRLFKIEKRKLILKLSDDFSSTNILGLDIKVIIELIINAIDKAIGLEKTLKKEK